jgi:hypothetical protein
MAARHDEDQPVSVNVNQGATPHDEEEQQEQDIVYVKCYPVAYEEVEARNG